MPPIDRPDPRNYQAHFDTALYARYHKDVLMPLHVREGARAFLPPSSTPLGLSKHYKDVQEERNLPAHLLMPKYAEIIDVTVVRETWAIFRVLVRAPWYWGRQRARHDIVLALEGDYCIVTAYWIRREDEHETLDRSAYEQPIGEKGE